MRRKIICSLQHFLLVRIATPVDTRSLCSKLIPPSNFLIALRFFFFIPFWNYFYINIPVAEFHDQCVLLKTYACTILSGYFWSPWWCFAYFSLRFFCVMYLARLAAFRKTSLMAWVTGRSVLFQSLTACDLEGNIF